VIRRAGRLALFAALGGAVVWSAQPAHAAAARPSVRRVLVISLPGIEWADLQDARVPNLRALFAQSALADMSLRGANDNPTLADGYVTMNTGARAEARPVTGGCVATGRGEWSCPAQRRIASHNHALLFDARVGLLGDTLVRAGVARVVANGTSATSDVPLALADHDGLVRTERRDRAVEVLEAGSLAGAASRTQRRAALAAFDATVGGLLANVDPTRDAVLVVAPGPPPGPLTTTVASLRAPGLRPGFLRSAYTRRAGVVALVDVGPTILALLDIERPSHMEGRPFEFGRTDGDLDHRIDWLADTNDRAQFRDRAITQAGGVFAAYQFTLAGAALIWLTRARRRERRVVALELAALTLLFSFPATYLAALLPFAYSGLPAYWLFVVAASGVSAALVYLTTDRRAVTPLLVALAVVVGVIVLDVLTGARLQFNGTFGYSPTIGGRYAGLGNLGFAQLAAGGVLLAGLLAARIGGRAGGWWAGVLLAIAILVDGLPFFGADVGGVLSMVPAFGVTVAMLFGWRFRWRLVAAFAAAAVVLLGIFVAVDLSRPADQRSHLGRLLGGNGGDLSVVLRRKLEANLDVVGATPFAILLPIVYVAIAYYVWRSPGPLGVVRVRMPAVTAALTGLGILAVLGTALNDSGIAITGVMFGVVVPVLVILAARVGLEPPATPRARDAEVAAAR
jgi:hypothetical protein